MEGEITFTAKLGEWISIKKMGVDEETKNEEIACVLSGIAESADRKCFQILGIDGELAAKLSAYVEGLAKGKRKGFSSLSEAVRALNKTEIENMAGGKCPYEVVEAYVVALLLEKLGYSARVSTEMLRTLYPELKLPKPRGRFK
ncbi:MAG: DUF2666 family protein [Candidatus Micrarchaeia archaeon]